MEGLTNSITAATNSNTNTIYMRNYLNSHPRIATKQIEYTCRGKYTTSVTLYQRGQTRVLFSVKQSGSNKKMCMEHCYTKVAEYLKLVKDDWKVQGNEEDLKLSENIDDGIIGGISELFQLDSERKFYLLADEQKAQLLEDYKLEYQGEYEEWTVEQVIVHGRLLRQMRKFDSPILKALSQQVYHGGLDNALNFVIRNLYDDIKRGKKWSSRFGPYGDKYKIGDDVGMFLVDNIMNQPMGTVLTIMRQVKEKIDNWEAYGKYGKGKRFSEKENWVCQGLDSDQSNEITASLDESKGITTTSENVTIVGAAESVEESILTSLPRDLLNLSSTEKIYDFTEDNAGIMSRFMPLETVNVAATEAGLIKSWRIIEDLVKINSITTLPIQGFMLGHYDLEFKLIAQGVPQQACLLMLGHCPNPYGLYDKFISQQGWTVDGAGGATGTNYPVKPVYDTYETYLSINASVMRPNVQLSLESQGEVTLKVKQKYHKTMIRNFDYLKASGTNPGIRGGMQGLLTLHALTPVLVGTGTSANFDIRILFRFVQAKLGAMTEPVKEKTTSSRYNHLYVVPHDFKDWDSLKISQDPEIEKKRQVIRAKYRVQGPAMSVLGGVKSGMMTAVGVIDSIEGLTGHSNKKIKNKDKPVDAVSQVTTIPRPRMNFTNGEGPDSAVIVGISWVELTHILQSFEDEPKSYKDLVNIPSLMRTIRLGDTTLPGSQLWSWNLQPTDGNWPLTPGQFATYGYANNWMNTTVAIVSSGFTNYSGGMILCGQFVKTMFHKASIEIAIRFGRDLTNNAIENSYVTIINVQDTSAFEVHIPYIYDTPTRPVSGSSTAVALPNTTNPANYAFAHSAAVTIRVLNRLIVGSGASTEIHCVLWLKGAEDFSLNFPRSFNSNLMPEIKKLVYPPQVISVTQGLTTPLQFAVVARPDTNSPRFFQQYTPNTYLAPNYVQGPGEERHTILTNTEHLNFKSILKMPVKIINYYSYEPWVKYNVNTVSDTMVEVSDRAYITLPVAPLNSTFVQYLTNEIYGANKLGETLGCLTQSHAYVVNTMFGMFSGSLALTIIVDEGDSPVYWAYLPHDYRLRKLYGGLNQTTQKAVTTHSAQPVLTSKNWKSVFLGTTTETHMDLMSAGGLNGIIVPKVNPTEKIIIPMSAPLNWLLMNRSIMNESKKFTTQTMRENSEWFNGHLAIWCNTKCKISVLLNMGDDFELGGFLGHPGFPNIHGWINVDDDRRVDLTKFVTQGQEVIDQNNELDDEPDISEDVKGEVEAIIANDEDASAETQAEYDKLMREWENEQPIQVPADPQVFRTQGESGFQLKDLTLNGWKSLKSMIVSTAVTTAATLALNEVDKGASAAFGAVALYTCMGGVQQLIRINRSAEMSSEIVQESVQVVRETTEELAVNAMAEIKNMLDQLFPFLRSTSEFMGSLWNIAQHLVHAALAKNWSNAAFAGFCVMMEMKLLEWKDWKKLCQPMELFFSRAQSFVTQGPETWTSLAQVLTSLICAKVQVKADGGLQSYLAKIFSMHDYRAVGGLNSILSLVRTVMNAVSVITNWAFQEADPNIAMLTALQNQGEDLEDFAAQASEFLTFFADLEVTKRENRIKYLALILRAIKIREILVRVNDPKIAGPLLQTCVKVIEKANSVQYLLQCDIVKQEPFILWLEGESKIGKSFCVYKVIGHIFKEAGYALNTTDYIFTVNLALQFMNGLRSCHKAWFIDDALTIRDIESIKRFVDCMISLKTSTPFNVPRAEIENKDQVAQPQLVVVTSNKENAFPQISEVPCIKALLRRRDYMVHFELANPQYSLSDYSEEEINEFLHLVCMRYRDVTDPNSLASKRMTFDEFLGEVSKEYVEYMKVEQRNQFKKYQYLIQCLSKNAIDSLNIGNPFELITKCNYDQPSQASIRMMVEDEVCVLMETIKQAEFMKDKLPRDEQVFATQGFFEKFRSWVDWFTHYIKTVYKLISNTAIRCMRCSDRAFSQGTSIWCEDGGHHLCLACSSNDLQQNVALSTLRCPMHPSSRITVETSGVLQSMFANLVDQKLDGSNMTLHMIATALEGNIEASAYLSVLRAINMTCSLFKFATQDEPEEINNPIMIDGCTKEYLKSLNVSNYYYPVDQLSIKENMMEKFLYLVNMGLIPAKNNYVCPHSLLAAKFNFYGGKYVLIDEPEVILEDFVCDQGICALSHVVFLQTIVDNFDVTWNLCQEHKNRSRRVIERNWPKFLWPAGMKEAKDLNFRIKKFLKTSWWEQYMPESPILQKLIKVVCPILAVLGVCWASAKAATALWNWISQYIGFGPQAKTNADYGHSTRSRVLKTRKTRVYSTQSTQNFENKLDKIANNYIVLEIGSAHLTAWGVKGSTFLIPKHLTHSLKSQEEFLIHFPTREEPPLSVRSDNIEIILVPDRDLAKCTIKQGKILFKDCSKFLQKRAITDWIDRTGLLMQVENKTVFDVETRILNTMDYSTATNSRGIVFSNSGSVVYDYQKAGLCGSLLCVDSVFPIISMHISGSESLNKGIGVILYQEDFEVQGASLVDMPMEEVVTFGVNCQVQYVGVVEPSLVAFVPSKSTIVPSAIAPAISRREACELLSPRARTYPAFLSRVEFVQYNNTFLHYRHPETPLIYGVRKNGRPSKDFSVSHVERAFKEVVDLILSGETLPKEYVRVMSVEEAVMGINLDLDEEDPLYFGKLPLDTSSGWPYSTSQYMKEFAIQKKTKDGWITVEYNAAGFPEKCKIHQKIIDDHYANMRQRERGEPAFNVFQDCLKDEKRKEEKVLSEGGTRLFSMSNIEGSIALRRFTLSLTNHIKNNRIYNGVCVGINPESPEWTFLADVIRKHDNYFTTDFTNFGAGLNYYCGMKFADLIKVYYIRAGVLYEEKQLRSIDALIQELMGSYHIAHNTLYRTLSGSPSGACITVEINSFVHLMYVVICWSIVCDLMYEKRNGVNKLKYKYPELYEYLQDVDIEMNVEDFAGNVTACVYGDDGIFSVSNEFVKVFNGVVINLILKEHGIGVTDASKSQKIMPTVAFEECTFLKRKFVTHPLCEHMYCAEMEWMSIEECVKWIHKSSIDSNESRTRENCLQSLRLSWGHGEHVYTKWQNILNALLMGVRVRGIHTTWMELAREMYPDLCVKFC
ncbi:polyprotein [Culex Iflavi-like virus 4]|uniref:polyprotein n=1 Tax=Culex Iflavi-like virus 4 TaxID=2304480 RepID=UPI000E35C80F|nr:polyprotein [Culex Iflavi-like virus 4]AXQ04787.1 polyprotein [Culex Iflavi-like virus 4]